jgi:hypothetical protein
MPGWKTKRFAAYALILGLATLDAGLLLGCHSKNHELNTTQPPSLSYQSTLMLATAGQLYTSVAPDCQAFYYENGVGSFETTGITFSVLPVLPAGLALNASTGIISGTPQGASGQAVYTITASNYTHDGGGATPFQVTLGVLATSPVGLDYRGAGAASTSVNVPVTLYPPTVSGGTATGFGVSPALPAGLSLNPSTGLVSGTPTAAIPATTFTLTATTPDGSADATFTLLVSATLPAAPLGLAYAGGPFAATVGQAFTGPTPTFSSTPVDVVYTVAPELPAGLSLDPLSGVISGTPLADPPNTSFTITATNGGGLSQAGITLTVNS